MRTISYRALFIMIAASLLMMGCVCNPVVKIKTEIIAPPSYLTEKVEPETPPIMNTYVGLRYLQKEEVLIDKFRAQTLIVETLNAQMDSIRKWVDDQVKLKQEKE